MRSPRLASNAGAALPALLVLGALAAGPGCPRKPPAKKERAQALAYTKRLAAIHARAMATLAAYKRLERTQPPDSAALAQARARIRADLDAARKAYRALEAPFAEARPLHQAFGRALDAWAAFVARGIAVDELRAKHPPPSADEVEHTRDRAKQPLLRWAAAHAALKRAQAAFARRFGIPKTAQPTLEIPQ